MSGQLHLGSRQEILETDFTIDLPDNCDYVECDNSITSNPGDLSFLELNIRGLYSKMPGLLNLIEHVSCKCPPDILLLYETWLSQFLATKSVEWTGWVKKGGGHVHTNF